MANLMDLAKCPRHIEILIMAPQHTLIEETYKYNIWDPLATIGRSGAAGPFPLKEYISIMLANVKLFIIFATRLVPQRYKTLALALAARKGKDNHPFS